MSPQRLKRFRKRIVVIVEDSTTLLRMLSDAISDLPIDVMTATTAEGGLDIMQSLVTDLVVQDVFMPGRGGLWAIEQMRERDPDVKILAISGGWGAMESDRTLKAAKVLGCDACLIKPFDMAVFRQQVIDLLGGEFAEIAASEEKTATSDPSTLRFSEA